jgi:glycosyltransferase involved in cell wall biosynthesis
MRILLVHNFYREPGGEDVVFAQEQSLLKNKGHDVVTYTRSNDEASDESTLGRIKLLRTIVSAPDSKRDIAAIIQKHQPDLIHIHNSFMMISPSIYEACWEARIPTVKTIHNYRLLCPAAYLFRKGSICEECMTHGLMRGVSHGCYRESKLNTAAVAVMLKYHRLAGTYTEKVNAFIALTEFAKNKLVANGFPADRLHVKSNFVDPDPGAREGAGQHALFAGRLSPEKGPDVALKAWARVKYPIQLKIAGDGPELESLKNLAASLGLTNVEFLGRVDRSQMRLLMKTARFLVLPSLWYEGFPMVLAECFACGVPAIGSRLGAMEEIINHGFNGLHFTAASSEDLADQVNWACENPQRISEMGRNARQTYESKYRASTNYETLMSIYGKAIDSMNEHRSGFLDEKRVASF